ncbi:MAG: YceI family protein [Phycisphaerales bacterium]|nr:YceI family protein [Phycisphaerales bacterium]
MRKTIASMMLSVAVFAAAATVAADEYKVDAVHSSAIFRIKHMNVSYSYGRFNDISGTIKWDDEKTAESSLKVEVKVASIDTADAKRDAHLKSADFFDAEKHPTITFQSKSIKKTGDNKYEVAGELTLHGVTKPLTISLDKTGAGADPWGGNRAGFETTFTIKRSEFGMDKMLTGAGDEVRMIVSLEGVKQ